MLGGFSQPADLLLHAFEPFVVVDMAGAQDDDVGCASASGLLRHSSSKSVVAGVTCPTPADLPVTPGRCSAWNLYRPTTKA